MAASHNFLKSPSKTPMNDKVSSSARKHHHQITVSSSSYSTKSRFDTYNRLQSAAVVFGEKLHIPEIVALGGQSDGKSSLLEALLGFRFNVREVEMGTRRPLILQMIHDPTALDPKCRFQVISAKVIRNKQTGQSESYVTRKSLGGPIQDKQDKK